MRIVVDYTFSSGKFQGNGIESSAQATRRGLKGDGNEVFPIRFAVSKEREAPLLTAYIDEEGAWYEISVPQAALDAFRLEVFSWRQDIDEAIVHVYCDFFKKTKPDIILLNAFPWFQYYIFKAAQKMGIPYVMWHHGLGYMEAPYLTVPNSAQNRFVQWEKEVAENATAEFFLTAQSKKMWREKYPTPEERDTIVPLPIDDFFFTPFSKSTVSGGIPRLGWVARWESVKRPEYVLEIARKLEGKYEVHAVTRLPKDIVEHEEFFKPLIIHAPMSFVSLRSFYASIDACILPSILETMGKVILEAAMCGKPTFITPQVCLADIYRSTGMEEYILSGEDAEEDVQRVLSVSSPACTDAFIFYIQAFHTPDTAYTHLRNTLQEVAVKH